MFLINVNAYYVGFMDVGVSASDDGSSAKKVDECLQELKLHPSTHESRVLGSLYCFVRSGDNLILGTSPINRDI